MADWWRKKYPERYERLSLARHTVPKVNLKALLAELQEAALPPHKPHYVSIPSNDSLPF
jgi:hypothetical protein